MKEQHPSSSPVSFAVHVARLPKLRMPVVIEADEKQRRLLAQEHGLLRVESFHAELQVEPWKRHGVRVSGRVSAAIVQACIVTLDPLPAAIDEPIEAVFLPEDSKLGRLGFEDGGEILLDPDGPDSPETFSGDMLDVGALAEEFFGLALDPYPRKSGVELPAAGGTAEENVAEWQQKLRGMAQKT